MPQILRNTQIIIDFLLILTAFCFAYFFRVGFIFSTDFPFSDYANVFIPTAIIWMLVLLFQKVYTLRPIPKRQLFIHIITSNLIGITIFVLIFFYKRDVFFSRLILVYVWGISSILLIANTWIFKIIKFHIFKKGIGTKKVLIVGTNKNAVHTISNLQKNEPYYQVVAILAPYGSKKSEILNVPIIGKMNSLLETIKEKNIQVIIQADAIEQSINLIDVSIKNKIDYFLCPTLLAPHTHNIVVSELGKEPLIQLKT